MNTSLLLATFPVKQPHSGRSHPQLTSGTFSEMCTDQKQQNMKKKKKKKKTAAIKLHKNLIDWLNFLQE